METAEMLGKEQLQKLLYALIYPVLLTENKHNPPKVSTEMYLDFIGKDDIHESI